MDPTIPCGLLYLSVRNAERRLRLGMIDHVSLLHAQKKKRIIAKRTRLSNPDREIAGMVSRSRVIFCCWAGNAAPDLKRSRKCSTWSCPAWPSAPKLWAPQGV